MSRMASLSVLGVESHPLCTTIRASHNCRGVSGTSACNHRLGAGVPIQSGAPAGVEAWSQWAWCSSKLSALGRLCV